VEVDVFTLAVHWRACANNDVCKCLKFPLNKLSECVVPMSTEAPQTESGTLCYEMFSIFRLLLENRQGLIIFAHENIKVIGNVEGMRVPFFKVHYSIVL